MKSLEWLPGLTPIKLVTQPRFEIMYMTRALAVNVISHLLWREISLFCPLGKTRLMCTESTVVTNISKEKILIEGTEISK